MIRRKVKRQYFLLVVALAAVAMAGTATPAFAQAAVGGDLSQVAENVITWLGSGAAGRFLLCADMVTCIFAAFHLTSWRTPLLTFTLGGIAWMSSYALSSWVGWSVG